MTNANTNDHTDYGRTLGQDWLSDYETVGELVEQWDLLMSHPNQTTADGFALECIATVGQDDWDSAKFDGGF